MYKVLDDFIPICEYKGDLERQEKYKNVMANLRKALNTNGWDGRWYKRAFMDNGDILGSLQNEECRIDSIAQSWATISGAGDNDKKYISLESLENHLVDKEDERIKFEKIKNELKRNLNQNGWDGRWYKRAINDDGFILGSSNSKECKIDSIAQSWSIISEAGNNDKKHIALESAKKYLIDEELGIIKVLTPGFKDGEINPGYIKKYPEGVRENGGQYTHASCWAIIAESMLGFGGKALEYFRMINPIEHARTKESASKYKVEPYVIAADIYGQGNLSGRGGWTWYTGSSSWIYTAGVRYILGLTIENGFLAVNPSIPNDWKEYSIRYKNGESIYNIKVENPDGKSNGVNKFIVNGEEIEEKRVKLDNNSGVYNIIIVM